MNPTLKSATIGVATVVGLATIVVVPNLARHTSGRRTVVNVASAVSATVSSSLAVDASTYGPSLATPTSGDLLLIPIDGQTSPLTSQYPLTYVDPTPGGSAEILQSVDGGKSFRTVLTASAPLDGFTFSDVDHGWALGATDLYATDDGGGTWSPVSEPPSPLVSVHFSSATTGEGVTAAGTVAITSNGGASWSLQGAIPAGSTSSCTDPNGSLVVGGPTDIEQSSDNGVIWTKLFFVPSTWGAQGVVLRCAGTSIWGEFALAPGMSTQPSVVELSKDSGTTWAPVGSSGSSSYAPTFLENKLPQLFALSSPTTAVATFLCSGCNASGNQQLSTVTFVGTNDSGQSFSQITIPSGGYVPRALSADGAGSFYLDVTNTPLNGSANQNFIVSSSNGGVSWNEVSTTAQEG
jgi:hypothetical protein